MEAVLQCVPSRISEEMNANLIRPLSEEEIKIAVFVMCPSIAPSPDGFPVLSYQKYWEIVKGKTVEACLQVLNHGASVLVN